MGNRFKGLGYRAAGLRLRRFSGLESRFRAWGLVPRVCHGV